MDLYKCTKCHHEWPDSFHRKREWCGWPSEVIAKIPAFDLGQNFAKLLKEMEGKK